MLFIICFVGRKPPVNIATGKLGNRCSYTQYLVLGAHRAMNTYRRDHRRPQKKRSYPTTHPRPNREWSRAHPPWLESGYKQVRMVVGDTVCDRNMAWMDKEDDEDGISLRIYALKTLEFNHLCIPDHIVPHGVARIP